MEITEAPALLLAAGGGGDLRDGLQQKHNQQNQCVEQTKPQRLP